MTMIKTSDTDNGGIQHRLAQWTIVGNTSNTELNKSEKVEPSTTKRKKQRETSNSPYGITSQWTHPRRQGGFEPEDQCQRAQRQSRLSLRHFHNDTIPYPLRDNHGNRHGRRIKFKQEASSLIVFGSVKKAE
jgi:hypothetical protein